MIQLPIEIGDTILAGRFKNKRITVREIGLDDFGLPTINGRGILKIRIPKLYVKENTMTNQKYVKIVKSGSNYHKTDGKTGKSTSRPTPENEQYNIIDVKTYDTIDMFFTDYESAKKYVKKKNWTLVSDKYDLDSDFNPNTIQRFVVTEGSTDSIPVKIKKEEDRYFIYIQYPDETEKCITNVGFESEDLALHSVTTKGYTLVNDKPNKFTEPPKAMSQRSNEFKLSESSLNALKRLVMEVLNEVDVTDKPELEAEAKRYAELANKMKVLEAELKAMATEYEELDNKFRPLLETVGTTKDTFIRAGKMLIKIERSAYDKKNPSYKTGFVWLHERVNGVMKELADEAMAMVETTSRVKSKIAVVNTENKINEGKFGDLVNKFVGWVKSKITKLFTLNKSANNALDKLEKAI